MPTFGAIRWDAFYTNDGPARYTRQALSAPGFRGRAPLHADISKPFIEYNPTQATMDAEITAAKNANLGYWAFLRYRATTQMNAAFELYQTSSIKAQVPYCWILYHDSFGSTGNFTSQVAGIVTRMQDTHWIKVLTNRPLLYILWDDSTFTGWWGGSMVNFKAAIDALRAACISAGLGSPYIVTLHGFSSVYSSGAMVTGIAADAGSAYIAENISGQLEATYASLDTSTQAYWAALAAATPTIVPICMTGWDRRPRIQRPVSWEVSTQKPQVGHLRYVVPPAPAELATHLQAAKTYIAANPSVCPADTALIYAWNEFDEGGAIAPSHDGRGQALLSAVASTLS